MVAFAATADAQGFLKKLKDKALNAVEGKVEDKVERETNDAMDGVLDGKKSSKKQRESVGNDDAAMDDSPQTKTSSDFKRGSVILFQDDVTAEQVGESIQMGFVSRYGRDQDPGRCEGHQSY